MASWVPKCVICSGAYNVAPAIEELVPDVEDHKPQCLSCGCLFHRFCLRTSAVESTKRCPKCDTEARLEDAITIVTETDSYAEELYDLQVKVSIARTKLNALSFEEEKNKTIMKNSADLLIPEMTNELATCFNCEMMNHDTSKCENRIVVRGEEQLERFPSLRPMAMGVAHHNIAAGRLITRMEEYITNGSSLTREQCYYVFALWLFGAACDLCGNFLHCESHCKALRHKRVRSRFRHIKLLFDEHIRPHQKKLLEEWKIADAPSSPPVQNDEDLFDINDEEVPQQQE